MLTPRTRVIVSHVALIGAALASGACARPAIHDSPPIVEARALAIPFDNEATVHVHVYLVTDRREWLLGRVEPGAHATLRIPAESLAEPTGFVRLAVIADAAPTLRASRDPRATFAVAQPASSIVSQRWTYASRQSTPAELLGLRR